MKRTDAEIIELLRRNSRMKNTEIARRIGLTEGAVRARIASMIKKGTIRKFTVETEPVGVEAIVLVRMNPERSKEVLATLRKLSESIYETSGEFDAAVTVFAMDVDSLNSKVDSIRGIQGISGTMTLIRLA